ncbi:MAG: glycosyltransferase family 2 protein, partial [Phycisphaerae bacterium]|nr:glycosyltransferase family 2 protein [Phycisphaerae bacterium]
MSGLSVMAVSSNNSIQESQADRIAPWLSLLETTAQTVSLVIPAYDEEMCIGRSLREVMNCVAAYPAFREVIVVDDGSTDRTAAIVEDCRKEHTAARAHLILLRHERNQGKGAAVRTGLSRATGCLLYTSDAADEFRTV